MNRKGHENIDFFTGIEIEKNPAYGKNTLFVVGIQPIDGILSIAKKHESEHIYFGSNASFDYITHIEFEKQWVPMIVFALERGFFCTLDFDVCYTELISNSVLPTYQNFIPVISVKLPNINELGPNATLKLDDIDFKGTNSGVWCHSLVSLKTDKTFTDWSEYSKDTVIHEEDL